MEEDRKHAVRKRRRRRKQRRMRRLGICLALTLALAGGAFGIQKLHKSGWDNALFHAFDSVKLDAVPQSLQELYERNPETEQFVLDYTKEKNEVHEIDLSGEIKEGEIPLFLQWDKRWGYEQYGNDMIAVNGCGPTCLSMVLCGLSGSSDWSPLAVAQFADREGFYVKGSGSSWSLMSRGAKMLGLTVHEIPFKAEDILETLQKGRPVICIMGPGDFTTTGHFIVLSGVTESGRIIVRDPFCKSNSEKEWDLETIMSQTRGLWAYSYTES